MTIRNAIASLAVNDLGRSISWYEALLSRSLDSRPMADLAEWKFPGGGWLQVYMNQSRAGLGSVTLAVSDIDEQIATLRRIGIDPGLRMDSAKAKVIMVRDPDGNSIAFAQAIDPSTAQ